MPRHRLHLPLLLLTLGCVVPAAAQPDGAVETYIARTGEILAWATELVEQSPSVPARNVLAQAETAHAQSIQLQAAGRPRQALAASHRARNAAQHAARLAREDRGFEERARVRLDRYRDFYDQLRDRAREADDRLALRTLDDAEL